MRPTGRPTADNIVSSGRHPWICTCIYRPKTSNRYDPTLRCFILNISSRILCRSFSIHSHLLNVSFKSFQVYWFTVEFGLCQEGDEIRALGAGLLSSYGELENAFSDRAEKRAFLPELSAIQPYDDVGYQPVYFVCDSIAQMKKQFRSVNCMSVTNNQFIHFVWYSYVESSSDKIFHHKFRIRKNWRGT